MSLINLTNRADIECDSLTIINNNGRINVGTSITNLNNTVNSVTGIPIETLNSLQKIGEAIDNDPLFFTNINSKIDAKQATLNNGTAVTNSQAILSGTKIKNIVPSTGISMTSNIDNITITGIDSYDKLNIDAKLLTINTDITNKQATLSNTTEVANSKTLLINNKIKNLVPGDKINFSSSTDDSITINGIDAYTKAETAIEIGKLVNGAPAVLDTLKEIADFIGDSTTISGNLINLISNKSNSSDTFLKSVINTNDISLTLSPNKRILGTSTANQFKFQILDNAGGSFTDAWIDVAIMDFNIATKKAKIIFKDSLFIDSTDILTTLNNKAFSSDTFKKTILNEKDVYLDSGNKQIVSIESATANNIIFNIRDTVGTIIGNNIVEAFKIEMNPQTKQISCYIPHKLIVNSINIIDELATKISTSNTFVKTILNNDVYLTLSANKRIVATSTANQFKFQILDNQGTTFTDAWIDVATMDFNISTKKAKLTVKDSLFVDSTDVLTTLNNKLFITDPKITQTAVAFSSVSFAADGTPNGAYNFINTGTDTLSIKVDSSTISAAFFGPNAGAQKGNVQFYKDVNITGDLKVGTTNILTELNNKLSSTDPKITQTAVNFSSVSFAADGTPNGAYNFINTGTDTLSIKVDSSTISAAFFGPNAGAQKGNVQFYKDVNISGALKVGTTNILTELNNKTSLTNTFEKTILNNDVYLILSNNKRIVSTATGNQIKFQINDNQGTTFTDAWIDAGVIDFNITTKRTRLTIKDDLFIGTSNILTTFANLTTTTLQTFLGEIKAPIITLGTTNLLNTACSWTSGASNATHTINTGPNWLSFNTPNKVAFEVMGQVNGVLDEGNVQFFYKTILEELVVQTGGISTSGNLTVSRNAPTGNGNVSLSVNNTSTDGLGFSSIYIQAKNEIAQLFVGQQTGLNIITHTANSIKFKTYNNDGSSGNAIEISGSGTKDVIIYTPLIVKSQVTTFEKGIEVGTTHGSGANGLYVANNAVINGNLTVNGTTTFTQVNPHWIAVMIVYINGVPSIGRNAGRYPITGLRRVSGFAAGVFHFDFPEHPFGTGYIVNITANAGYGTIYGSSRSSTRFGVTTRNISNALFDTETHILISAY